MHISVKEAAELLGKSQRTIRHLAQTGKLPAQRIGSRWLIQREDLLLLKDDSIDFEPPEQSLQEAPHPPQSTPPIFEDCAQNQATMDKARYKVDFVRALRMTWNPNPSPISVQKMDSFSMATSILAETTALRARHSGSSPADSWLANAEQALGSVLQAIADGCHHRRLLYKIARFEQAQSHACTALTHLLHYNMLCSEPDFSTTCEQIEQELLPSLQELMEQVHEQLSLRGQLTHSAEFFVHKLFTQAREIINQSRIAQHVMRWQKQFFA